MSIQSMTDRDAITIARKVEAQSASGAEVGSFTAAGRGALPTSMNCRIWKMEPEEQVSYGIAAGSVGWVMLFHSNPTLYVKTDQVTFIDPDGVTNVIDIVGDSKDVDHQGRLWKALGETRGAE